MEGKHDLRQGKKRDPGSSGYALLHSRGGLAPAEPISFPSQQGLLMRTSGHTCQMGCIPKEGGRWNHGLVPLFQHPGPLQAYHLHLERYEVPPGSSHISSELSHGRNFTGNTSSSQLKVFRVSLALH